MASTYLLALCVVFLVSAQSFSAFKLEYEKRSEESNFVPSAEEENLFFNTLIPAAVTVTRLGRQLVLQCSAGGSPTPTIHWLFKRTRVPQGLTDSTTDDQATFEASNTKNNMPTLQLGGTQSRLFLDCVTEENLGEYTCVADTPTQRISTSTLVKTDTPAGEFVNTCMMKRLESGNPARIYMWTVQRLEYEGVDVQLYCRTDGSPAPHVKWFDTEGVEIPRHHTAANPQMSQYQILGNGDLLIKRVNWSKNMGTYKCVAENNNNGHVSSDEVETFLYPTYP